MFTRSSSGHVLYLARRLGKGVECGLKVASSTGLVYVRVKKECLFCVTFERRVILSVGGLGLPQFIFQKELYFLKILVGTVLSTKFTK